MQIKVHRMIYKRVKTVITKQNAKIWMNKFKYKKKRNN